MYNNVKCNKVKNYRTKRILPTRKSEKKTKLHKRKKRLLALKILTNFTSKCTANVVVINVSLKQVVTCNFRDKATIPIVTVNGGGFQE